MKRERLAHRVRMQSLLVVQGIRIRIKGAARLRLETLTLWDGRPLPVELKAELEREVMRLALVERQIIALETAGGVCACAVPASLRSRGDCSLRCGVTWRMA